ncbi:MAG TPA: hypothetical protein VFK02_07630 [Kofleriaceae bacterium]|nr:hypothetical protein [Kofleriaceae bacterium]
MLVPSTVTIAPDSGASRSGDRTVPVIVAVSAAAVDGDDSVGFASLVPAGEFVF